MNRWIDDFSNSEFEIGKFLKCKSIDAMYFCAISVIALIARVALFSFASRDYQVFLNPWFERLKSAGGLAGIGISIGDYTPPYIYIMAFLTHLPISSLTSIKLVSILFDFLAAGIIMVMVYNETKKAQPALLGYTVALLAPTVILNSALWAQCDIIFTFFLLLCVYYFTKDKPFLATLWFAIAFAFKLQAIFLAPFLLLMWLKGRMKFRHFALIPIVYIVFILPAWIMGRPFFELLTIYISQSGQYSALSLNAPNFYLLVKDEIAGASIFATMLCGGVILYLLYSFYQKSFEISNKIIVGFAFLFSLIVPFLLPHMHERYFFLADVLAICYAFYCPKRFYLPIAVILSSLLCYSPYLFKAMPIPLEFTAIVILAVICIVLVDLDKFMKQNVTKKEDVKYVTQNS